MLRNVKRIRLEINFHIYFELAAFSQKVKLLKKKTKKTKKQKKTMKLVYKLSKSSEVIIISLGARGSLVNFMTNFKF